MEKRKKKKKQKEEKLFSTQQIIFSHFLGSRASIDIVVAQEDLLTRVTLSSFPIS